MPSEELKVIISAKDQASAAIGRIGQSLQGLSTMALAASSALAGVFVYKTVKSFADFDEAMTNSLSVMGQVDAAMREKLINTAREVGRTTTVSAKEAAQGYYYLASAGLSAAEAMAAMPKIARLAEAAHIDMATATDIAVNALRAFGLEVEDIEHVNDTLIGTVTRTNTNLLQLAEALKYVAPVAHSVGWSIEEVSAAIGILANSGIKGSQAGTGLRRVLSELLNPSDRAREVFQELGLTMDDLNPKTHSLTEVLQTLKEHGATTAQVMAIFGDRGGNVALNLMEASTATQNLTEQLRGLKGETENVASIQETSLSAQLKKLKNNIEDVSITIGEQLAPVIEQLSGKLTELAQNENVKNFVKEFGTGMADGFTAMADAMAGVSSGLTQLGPGFGRVLGALTALAMVVGPILIAFKALASVFSAVSAAAGVIGPMLSAIGPALGALAAAIGWPIIAIGLLIAAIAALAFNIGGARDKVVDFASWLKEGLVGALKRAWEGIKKFAEVMENAISTAVDKIKEYGPKALAATKALAEKVVNGLRDGLASLKDKAAEKLEGLVDAIKALPEKVKSEAVKLGKAAVDGIKNGLSNLTRMLKDALLGPIKDAINKVKEILHIGSPSKVFAEIGRNIVEGYEEGIEGAARKLNPVLPGITISPARAMPAGVSSYAERRTANVNISLSGVAIRQDDDIERLADEIEERLGRRLAW